MKTLKRMLAMLLLAALVVTMTACSSEEKPEAALDKFCVGYNSLNIEKMMDSFDPQVMAPYKVLLKLGSEMLGFDVNDLVQLLPLADLIDPSLGIAETQPKISYVLHSKTINGNTATINVTLTMKAGSQVETATGDLPMVKVEGEWYISADWDGGSSW